ncbi:MAG: sulfonate transport system permease protein [Pseudonocardiales bacterium]|nr:sulfonate transport system permease protein [Pseudonocardiales bacterium]
MTAAKTTSPAEPISVTKTGVDADDETWASTGLRARRIRRRILLNVCRLALVVLALGSWETGVNSKHIDPFFWGQPSGVWRQLKTWVTDGTAQGSLAEQIMVTMQEAVYGFLIGVSLGVVLGIALGRNRFLSDLLSPFIKVANSIPRIVLGALFSIAFGFGLTSKVVLAVVLVFFGVFFNAFQGTREVDRNLLSNARILGASRWQTVRHVVLPSAFTWILASLHISFGFALIGAVVGELLGADKGMGLLIRNAQNNFNPNGVLAGMVVIAVIALVAEGLITALEKRLLRWRPPQAGGDLTII